MIDPPDPTEPPEVTSFVRLVCAMGALVSSGAVHPDQLLGGFSEDLSALLEILSTDPRLNAEAQGLSALALAHLRTLEGGTVH